MNWFKRFWNSIVTSNDSSFKTKILLLESKLGVADNNILLLEEDVDELLGIILDKDSKIKVLESSIKELGDSKLEFFWNNKIKPVSKYLYPARNGNPTNVVKFLTTNNEDVPVVDGINNDFKADNALKLVKNTVTYTSDLKENWQWANETVKRKLGDCEDGAILMANIMLKSGIPYWRIRLNAGTVKGGGHAYITYLRESDNQWYVLDWCYWYTESVGFKKLWSSAKKYFSPVWFSWNLKHVFIKDVLDR